MAMKSSTPSTTPTAMPAFALVLNVLAWAAAAGGFAVVVTDCPPPGLALLWAVVEVVSGEPPNRTCTLEAQMYPGTAELTVLVNELLRSDVPEISFTVYVVVVETAA